MTFRTALSGLHAAQSDLGVTAHNIANVNTPGFKRSRAEFGDVFAVSPYGLSRNAIGSGVRLTAVAQQHQQGSIDFTDNSLDLAISGQGFFTLSDNGQTVYSRAGNFKVDREGYVVNAVNQRLQVFPPQVGGNGFDTGRLADIQLSTADNAPNATSEIGLGTTLPANATAPTITPFDPADARTYNHTTSVTTYDSLGVAHVATFYYVKTANPNEWTVQAQIDGTAVGGTNTISYDDSGALVAPADGLVTLPAFTPTTGAADMNITLNLAESTQYGERFAVNELSQDGYTTGRLTSMEVSAEGVVFARYTNGQALSLGQVAMTNFPNAQGLSQLGDTTWGETFESGQPLRGSAGSGSFGLIQSGALEGSNVELTDELVNMITAQRNFQANAQMISTSDQINQTIINIR